MKIEKNKIVFTSILICILLFITAYAVLVLDEDSDAELNVNQIPIPELDGEQKIYDSKLDALNDRKTIRPSNAPNIYDENLLDSTGLYDPDLLNKEKMRIVDSIYKQGRIRYSEKNFVADKRASTVVVSAPKKNELPPKPITVKEIAIAAKELALEHQLFFASQPLKAPDTSKSNQGMLVRVDGTQTVQTDYRLRMRLLQEIELEGRTIPKNTIIYGFVSFKPNRTLIRIENIAHHPVRLTAFDLADGAEGVYLVNNLKGEATNEVIDDIVDDINISGIPQIKGIKQLFQRNRRRIKATITDNYTLILKYNHNPKKYYQ